MTILNPGCCMSNLLLLWFWMEEAIQWLLLLIEQPVHWWGRDLFFYISLYKMKYKNES